MSQQVIPLDASPNQTWQVSVSINGTVQDFFVNLNFNEVAGYWVMEIADSNQNLLLSDVPLLCGLNLLQQYQYLQIGSLYLLNVGNDPSDSPNSTNLGSSFVLVWGDNFVAPQAA